jgi:hypothetical protein
LSPSQTTLTDRLDLSSRSWFGFPKIVLVASEKITSRIVRMERFRLLIFIASWTSLTAIKPIDLGLLPLTDAGPGLLLPGLLLGVKPCKSLAY